MVRNYAPGIFSASFNRYEIEFTRQTTRFIKLVDQPQLDNTHIYPTELQGLVARTDLSKPQRATEHRGSATLRVTPKEWLSLSGGADILRTAGSLTSLAQNQDGYRTDFRVNPAGWADFSGRAVWSTNSFPQGSSEGLESNQYGVTWQAKWLPTLSTRSTASRVEEGADGTKVRRSDGLDFRATTQWLPGLEGMTEISYIENHQLTNGDIVWTRLYAQGFDAQLTPGSYFRIDYRYYDMSARFSIVPDYRESLYLRATYRLTRLIFLSGDLTRDREPVRNDYTENGQVTWTPTFKWTVSAGVTRTDAGEQGGSTLLVSQAMFRLTPRIDINFSYSHTSYDQATEPEVSSVRLGFNARI
jgi:hypothetical protein